MEKDDFIKIGNSLLFYKNIKVTKDEDLPTLVFLHDALGSVAQWKDFPRRLSQETGLNAIVYDRQGHGRSAPFSKPRTKDYLHQEAEKVLPELLEILNIKNPILVGHSDGGSIALIYAATSTPIAIICEAAHATVEKITVEGIKKVAQERTTLISKLEKYHGEKTEALFEAWRKTWLDPAFHDWNIQEELKNIQCPALILQGADDEYATADHVKLIANEIGQKAEACLINDCGHAPHRQAGKDTIQKMEHFIASIFLSDPSTHFQKSLK